MFRDILVNSYLLHQIQVIVSLLSNGTDEVLITIANVVLMLCM
jgi:hypothetical protein